MEVKNEAYKATQEVEEIFSLKDFFGTCLQHWRWFVLSVIVCLCLGAFYILRQQPEYERSMALLIKDQEGGGSADISSAFSSMGLVASNTNVYNELISLKSPSTMYEVIQRLGLDVDYATKSTFHNVTLYGSTTPVTVKFLDFEEQQSGGFQMLYYPDGSAEMDKFYLWVDGKKQKFEKTIKCPAGFSTVKTPLGRITVTRNAGYIPNPKYDTPEGIQMLIARSGMQSCVERYGRRLNGDLADKDAEVINLSIRDVSIQRAVDILNTIVTVYNENWIEDKNKVAIATSDFIDHRLEDVVAQLGKVDQDISQYKSEHLIPDLEEASKLYMQQSTEMGNDILKTNNELAMATYVRDYLNNPANTYNVIPVNTGIGSTSLEAQITSYNTLLLNRNNLVANSSETNPIVIDYDTQLRGMRDAITKAIATQIASLNATLRNFSSAQGQAQSQLASGPTQAKYLLSVERQQKVIESLYLYLLQKREENELTQAFSAYNTRIITPPTGSLKPVSPRKTIIMIVALLLGFGIPGVWLYVEESTNTKVRSKKDLDRLTAPFAGEIPQAGKKKGITVFGKKIGGKKKRHGELEKVLSVVAEGNRNAINEAFRIIRGNIDFMIGHSAGCNVFMMTSFNPGSGKSFISYNLSASFALKGKKVLVIDGDLRHGSLSQFVNMPHKGLSNYLTDATDDWKSLVVAVKENPGVFVLPIGNRPPNPSELLDNGRLGDLLKEARDEYDYIIIDCPPVDIVVDTQIVEKYVDRTVFVVRAGLLEKKAIMEIDEIYRQKRFKQMTVILNGTDTSHSTYSYYGGSGSYYGNH